MQKNFLYIPSLSAGAIAAALHKIDYFFKGTEHQLTPRYYSNEFPEDFRHKYFLVTAGYHYKNMNFIQDYGLEDSFVFGDSGGYQICMGRTKLTDDLIQRTFEFLENNSTVAANFDIPPKGTIKISFEESLNLSYKNFKYFADKQSGKTKYLNVLHGVDSKQIDLWYNTVKGMPFNGWACGSVYKKRSLLYTIAFLLAKGEFSKTQHSYLHLFGLSSVVDFMICAQLQKMFNQYGYDVTVMTDSSSPSLNGLYGSYVHGCDYKKVDWRLMKLKKGQGIDYNIEQPLPCSLDCPICNATTYKDFETYSTLQTQYIILHNTIFYSKESKLIQKIVYAPHEVQQSYIPRDIVLVLKSIEDMFTTGTPLSVFNKFDHLYSKFDDRMQVKHSVTEESFF